LDPFTINCQAKIAATAARRLRRGHLWVYAGEVEHEPAGTAPAIVRVVDATDHVLGYALYNGRSQIRLRLLTRGPEPPTQQLLRARIQHSIDRRSDYIRTASACRLIFGEGDLLPAIIVDRYGDYLVLQTLSGGAEALKLLLVDILRDILKPKGILERNDVRIRRLEGLEEIQGVLWGNVPDEVEIEENGVRFLIDMRHGQKTGFFLDQSQNRIAAMNYASGRALDCFANTGAFALHFARCCESVLAIDISSDSLRLAQRNSELNGISNVDFRVGNAFDILRELENNGQLFDLISLDPPAFAKNRKSIDAGRSGYKEINLRALKLLQPEGILVTSSCSYHMSESDFFDILCDAARDSRRFIQVLERRSQASDHPALAAMPETHYLKCFFLRAL
jgi:23S rRNA (cytosine1962-C5)-methyltransferase